MSRRTIVSLHAHPDDEVLLTGGSLAQAAAQGHRVVLVTATAGEQGLASAALVRDGDLGVRRRRELEDSAAALGIARIVTLNYPDSGSDQETVPAGGFARAPLNEVAERVADIVNDEGADLLTGYDVHGGYGHPDHLMVHRVARAVSDTTDVRLLEATVDADSLARALRLVSWLPGLPEGFSSRTAKRCWTPRSQLTHELDVRAYLMQKRAALAAHASQSTADGSSRTAQLLLACPRPIFRRLLGREWFVDPGITEPAKQLRTELWTS